MARPRTPVEPARWDFGPRLAEARAFLENRLGLEGSVAPFGPVALLRVGIPRALTTHSLYPLYAHFLAGHGREVVLSGVDADGELRSHSGFCFPAQLAHGAVLDLARRGVDVVFLPHITRMPHPSACRDSLLCLSNFSCTIDAFTHAMLEAELGAKPYLLLEIDAATADAGVQTRLEAFLDIVRNYRAAAAGRRRPFQAARLAGQGNVICSNGARVPLTDPRVKLYLPNFSQYHTPVLGLAMHWLGLHPGTVTPLARHQLERGLRYTSGRECLPLPLCIGQILQIHEQRAPGEIVGFFTVRGGAPCVSDAYEGYFERFIAEHELPDLFVLNASAENDYLGFPGETLTRHVGPAIVLADILVEIDHVLRVAGAPGTVRLFQREWLRFAATSDSLDAFDARLPALVRRLAALPRTRDPQQCPRVVVTGDFFTCFSPFFIEGVRELYAARGIILKPVDLADLVLCGAYDGIAGTANTWGLSPGNLAFAKACTRIFQADGKEYLQRWLAYQTQQCIEQFYRGVFRASGLLVAENNDVATLFDRAVEHVSPTIFGEAIPAVGKGVGAAAEGYDGTLLVGPFNCLPYRIAEAILRPLSRQHGVPILTCESDGYAVAPAFFRQVDVHIQQMLECAARRLGSDGGVAEPSEAGAVGRVKGRRPKGPWNVDRTGSHARRSIDGPFSFELSDVAYATSESSKENGPSMLRRA